MAANVELTGSGSSDGAIGGAGLRVVYWLFVEAGATGGAWSLEDGTDDSGTVKIAGSMAANERVFMPFPKPLEFYQYMQR